MANMVKIGRRSVKKYQKLQILCMERSGKICGDYVRNLRNLFCNKTLISLRLIDKV